MARVFELFLVFIFIIILFSPEGACYQDGRFLNSIFIIGHGNNETSEGTYAQNSGGWL